MSKGTCMCCGCDPCCRKNAEVSESDCSDLLACAPIRTIQDDFIFVYEKNGSYLVYGIGDAGKYKYKLHDLGFTHTATLSACVVAQNIFNGNYENLADYIESLKSS